MPEAVNHPKHYGGEDNLYEHIKVCDAWDLDYRLGNCTKYICRAGKKGDNALEDLKKALWYLNDAIRQLERKVNRGCCVVGCPREAVHHIPGGKMTCTVHLPCSSEPTKAVHGG